MKASFKKTSAKATDKVAYLTKRTMLRVSHRAVQNASERAMNLVGYVIKTDGDWIVRVNKDGSIKKIKRYKTSQSKPLVLDK